MIAKGKKIMFSKWLIIVCARECLFDDVLYFSWPNQFEMLFIICSVSECARARACPFACKQTQKWTRNRNIGQKPQFVIYVLKGGIASCVCLCLNEKLATHSVRLIRIENELISYCRTHNSGGNELNCVFVNKICNKTAVGLCWLVPLSIRVGYFHILANYYGFSITCALSSKGFFLWLWEDNSFQFSRWLSLLRNCFLLTRLLAVAHHLNTNKSEISKRWFKSIRQLLSLNSIQFNACPLLQHHHQGAHIPNVTF